MNQNTHRSFDHAESKTAAIQSHRKRIPLAVLILGVCASAPAQKVELLWPQGAPGAVGAEDKDKPSIAIYLAAPEKASGAAVVVCPGGGYGNLSMEKEGTKIAEWLNERGITAFV